MIDISSNLDKAFENDEREIKSYVRINYNKPKINYDEQTGDYGISLINYSPVELNISNPESMFKEIKENIPQYTDYATLEYNRLKLDGSLILPRYIDEAGKEENYAGYISNDVVNSDTEVSLKIGCNGDLIEGKVDGITIFFGDNIPNTIQLDAELEEDLHIQITNNEEQILNIDFETSITLGNNDEIDLLFTDWSKTDRRARIQRIELGHIEIYQNEEITNISVLEQVKKFCEETPENECSITLNNFEGQFDILNPKGITKYLTDKTTIQPYLGAITEDGIVEYVSMGKFYLDSWNNNSDFTTTLIGKNIIKKISSMDLKAKVGIPGPIDFDYPNKIEQFKTYLKSIYNLDAEIIKNSQVGTYNIFTPNLINKDTKILNMMQNYAICYEGTLRSNRFEKIEIKPINKQIKKYINNNFLIDEPKVDKIKKINTIRTIYDKYSGGTMTVGQENEFLNISHIMEENSDAIIVKFDSATNSWGNITASGGSVSLREFDTNAHVYVLTGTKGSTVTFSHKGFSQTTTQQTYEYIQEGINIESEEDKKILEIKGEIVIIPTTQYELNIVKTIFYNYFLENATEYNIEFEFNGNPALEAGDVIKVETKYGDMDIFIESIEHKYDGGLSSTIKGVDIKGAS